MQVHTSFVLEDEAGIVFRTVLRIFATLTVHWTILLPDRSETRGPLVCQGVSGIQLELTLGPARNRCIVQRQPCGLCEPWAQAPTGWLLSNTQRVRAQTLRRNSIPEPKGTLALTQDIVICSLLRYQKLRTTNTKQELAPTKALLRISANYAKLPRVTVSYRE